jgi:hypothetical protein
MCQMKLVSPGWPGTLARGTPQQMYEVVVAAL